MRTPLCALFAGCVLLLANAGNLCAVTITAATGGAGISADNNTNNASGVWTALTGPVAAETSGGSISAGTIVLNAPAGFVFNPYVSVVVRVTSGSSTASQNINGTPVNGTIPAVVGMNRTTITLLISTASTVANTLTWTGIQVRPVGGYPLAGGNITESGSSLLQGLVLSSGTWGALTEVAGAAARVGFAQQPTNAVAGAAIAPAVTVQVQDQFGNVVSNPANITVAISNNPAGGTLSGTTTVAASNGTATFNNLSIDKAGSGYTLSAGSSGLTGSISGSFNITPAVASKLAITSAAQTLTAGVSSAAITVQIQDAYGNAAAAGSARTVNLATASPFGVFRNAGDTATITSIVIATGANSTNFLYRDTLAGNPAITNSSTLPTTLASATQTETVNPGPVSKLQILLPGETAAPATVSGKTGAPTSQAAMVAIANGIVVNALDAYWNLVTSATPSVAIASSDPGAVVSDDNGVQPGNVTLVGGTGTLSSFTFFTAGTQTGTATDTAGLLAPAISSGVSVNPAPSTTALASSANPSAFGQAITFTATVSIPPGGGAAGGTISFKDGATILGTATLDGVLQATFTTAALSVGAHSITAVYGGDTTYGASTSPTVTQTVSKADTTLALNASTNGSVYGQTVVFTASVSAAAPGSGTPTGTVIF